MTRALTAHDPRYQELFDPAKEAANFDLTPAMSAWRERAPIMKGSLRELLGLPSCMPCSTASDLTIRSCPTSRVSAHFARISYSRPKFTRRARAYAMLGHTIVEMVGEEHRQQRAIAQPMFVRPMVMTWWKRNWIDEAVDTLVDHLMERFPDMHLDPDAPPPQLVGGLEQRGLTALPVRLS
jgi:hypothetical protein